MNDPELIRGLFKKTEKIKMYQNEIDEELLYTESWLDKFINDMDVVENRLKEIKSEEESGFRKKGHGEELHISEEDFEKMLEKLLEGPLQNLGNKISQRILDKLKDLKSASYDVRKSKIKELKELAASEEVDLSGLFREKIRSNLEDTGIEEREIKGIDKSLERLRKMTEDREKDRQEEE